MTLKIKTGRENMLQYGIVMTLSYASYATLIYSFLGYNSILRMLLITVMLGVDFVAVYKNSGRATPLLSIVGVIGTLFLVTYFVYPENRWAIKAFVPDMIKYVMFAYFLCIAREDTVQKSLKISAYLILFCNLFEPFTHYVTSGRDGYMVYGMRLLIAAVLLGYFYNSERKLIHLFAAFLSITLILIYGNRSALLISVIAFGAQYVIFAENQNKVVRIVLILTLAFLAVFFAGVIFSGLSTALEKAGISSRTVNKLLSGIEAVTDNTGRSVIWGNCRKAIAKRPWTGYGIGGERNLYLLGSQYVSNLGGVYAHNFFYEILLDFGVVLGTMIMAVLGWKSIRIIRSKDYIAISRLYMVLFLSTALKLFFSSSIWTDIDVYVCLGIAMNYYRALKHRRDEERYKAELE